jgi:hypothetical protein
MTKAEELALVDTAITRILQGAQSFTVLGRLYQRADLDSLYARKTELERDIARASRGGIRLRRMVAND